MKCRDDVKPGLAQSGRRGSNSRHSAWEADTLPTELRPQYQCIGNKEADTLPIRPVPDGTRPRPSRCTRRDGLSYTRSTTLQCTSPGTAGQVIQKARLLKGLSEEKRASAAVSLHAPLLLLDEDLRIDRSRTERADVPACRFIIVRLTRLFAVGTFYAERSVVLVLCHVAICPSFFLW